MPDPGRGQSRALAPLGKVLSTGPKLEPASSEGDVTPPKAMPATQRVRKKTPQTTDVVENLMAVIIVENCAECQPEKKGAADSMPCMLLAAALMPLRSLFGFLSRRIVGVQRQGRLSPPLPLCND